MPSANIRAQGDIARMSDPQLIKEIKQAVTIPMMAKAQIDHFVEAQILKAIGVDYVNECKVLTIAGEDNHINKHNFQIPFIYSYRNLCEALCRIHEGTAMIRTKGKAGTGNIIEVVRHVRSVMGDIRHVRSTDMKRMSMARRRRSTREEGRKEKVKRKNKSTKVI